MSSRTASCPGCLERIEPRGGLAPQFCPYCGARVRHEVPAARPRERSYAPPTTDGGAVASLLIGIASLALQCFPIGPLVLGVIAIIIGTSARRRIMAARGRLSGRGLAKAGVVLGCISIALHLLACGGFILG